MIQITIQPWWRFALFDSLEHDDCLWIFYGEGATPDGYLHEYEDFTYLFVTAAKEVYALWVLLVYTTAILSQGIHVP